MSYFLGKAFNAELYTVSDDINDTDSSHIASIVAVNNLKIDISKKLEIYEQIRKNMIGVPVYWRSTTLPENYCWANGDFIEFINWPELEEVYSSGGFEGMLLPWNASSEDQSANLGKWRPDAANPTGLFTPNLGGQFFRNWGQGVGKDAGAWGEDAIRNITGQASGANSVGPCYSGEGAIYRGEVQGNATYRNGSYGGYLMFDASRVVPTGPENVPPHVWQPVVLYLGRPT